MTTFVALLRAVNVGKRQTPMKVLKALVEALGYQDVRTYLASGNLLFEGSGSATAVERTLDEAISKEFGFTVETIVRTADEWRAHRDANPMPELSAREANRVLMFVSKRPPNADAADILRTRARPGETIAAAGGAIWIHFGGGVGTSLLSPDWINKAIGSPSTGRNWNTVCKLAELTPR